MQLQEIIRIVSCIFNEYKSYCYIFIAARCSQDVKGSDIVAIVVGTAVAGGLGIFFISITAFYIIVCLKSHKKSSYEPLT